MRDTFSERTPLLLHDGNTSHYDDEYTDEPQTKIYRFDALEEDDPLQHLESKCTVVGLDRCCRAYLNVAQCLKDTKIRLKRRKRRLESKLFTPETVWMDVQCPTPSDLKLLEQAFELHELTTEDISDQSLHEKFEVHDNYLFFVFGAQIEGDENIAEFKRTPINVIVYNNIILTVHTYPIKGLEMVLKRIGHEFEVQDVLQDYVSEDRNSLPSAINPTHNPLLPEQSSTYRYKYEKPRFLEKITSTRTPTSPRDFFKQKVSIPSSDWVLYALIDSVVDLYMPACERISMEVDTIDEIIVHMDSREHRDILRRIGLINKTIVELKRLMQPKERIARFVITTTSSLIGANVRIYMRDVLDHLLSCIERLESSKDTLTHTHSNYLTKVQISIAQASRSRTDAMNKIGIIAFIFTPISIVPGLWGVNVPVPGGDVTNLSPFLGIMASLCFMCLVTAIFTRLNVL